MTTSRALWSLLFVGYAAAASLGLTGCSRGEVSRAKVETAAEFTDGIEGAACDEEGNVYAVNLREAGTVGRLRPSGELEVVLKLPDGGVGNAIAFDAQGRMLVADYVKHRIWRHTIGSERPDLLVERSDMNQPNDFTLDARDTLYASDPSWATGVGSIWRITASGSATRVVEGIGTTNGIELSPDGRTLYVGESKERKIWTYRVEPDGGLRDRRLFRRFDTGGLDGMRTDIDGNLYVARWDAGVVAMIDPKGQVRREIAVLGGKPTNLCFCGTDGRTVYVTEAEKRRLVSFRVERPGASWSRRHAATHRAETPKP